MRAAKRLGLPLIRRLATRVGRSRSNARRATARSRAAGAPFPARDPKAGFEDRLRHQGVAAPGAGSRLGSRHCWTRRIQAMCAALPGSASAGASSQGWSSKADGHRRSAQDRGTADRAAARARGRGPRRRRPPLPRQAATRLAADVEKRARNAEPETIAEEAVGDRGRRLRIAEDAVAAIPGHEGACPDLGGDLEMGFLITDRLVRSAGLGRWVPSASRMSRSSSRY